MASLVKLTVPTVARHTPVPELLVYIEYLPTFIRHQLFQELPMCRLREMEVAWEAAAKVEVQKPRDGFDPLAGDRFLFDRETQREWEARLRRYVDLGNHPGTIKGRTRNCRHVFWEKEFVDMLSFGHVDEWMENQKLFVDVVRELELSSQFICKDNAKILLALRYLRKIEVLHLCQYSFCWKTMRRLVKKSLHLTELKFTYGSLSDREVAHLYMTLSRPTSAVKKRMDTCRITVLEFVKVELQPEGYRKFVALVRAMPQLAQLKVFSCMGKKCDKKQLLVNAALRLPVLQQLFLGLDWLEDDAFVGLMEIRKPLALRYLRLYRNNVSSETVEAICRASRDGVLNLEHLEVPYNSEIGPAMHALISMLASPVIKSATMLTHLDLRGCNFGLECVTSVLQALAHNKTLTHLNVGRNPFDSGFGDVLADFLLTNSSVTHLKAHCVNPDQDGVSARLLTALESNLTLTSLSLARNRFCSGGASAILGALIKRAHVKPFALVDLSRNLIEVDGLKMIADILEGFVNANGVTQADSLRRDEVDVGSRKRQRDDSSDKDQGSSFFSQCDHIVPIEELRLLSINFGCRRHEYRALIKSIQRCVGHLESNEWDQ